MDNRTAEFFEKMQQFFPSVEGEYKESIKKYGELLETVVLEDIFIPQLLSLLSENKNSQLLKEIFSYFEKIVNSDDFHLINVFSVTVLESLGNDMTILENAKLYMGPKTELLQTKTADELGRK